MKQVTKDRIIFWALILVKALTTLRTGVDTYTVSDVGGANALLNVLLIDGAFLTFWLIAAYGGKGADAIALRPYAAGGAVVLYGSMLLIGWSAHPGIIAWAVRVAGAIALGYDISDYGLSAWKFLTTKRKRTLLDVDDFADRIYARRQRRALRRGARANQAHLDSMAADYMRARLLLGSAPRTTDHAIEGEVVDDRQLAATAKLSAVDSHLLTVAEHALIHGPFKTVDAAEWIGKSRQYAGKIIKEGVQREQIHSIGDGEYIWHTNGSRQQREEVGR